MRSLQPFQDIDAVAKAGSIRKAAETLAVTSTALNRRILAIEEDLGVPIFERVARGVRLSAAGELLVHHIRSQMTDLERVKSQIADLSGVRRGHIRIACSQALLPFFLPEQIALYRREHPAVTFEVLVRDRAAAEQALIDLSADLALVFEPIRLAEIQTMMTIDQPVHAMMRDDHPLASRPTLRLRECLGFPIALPAAQYGVRDLLDRAMRRMAMAFDPSIVSDSFEFLRHYVRQEGAISFQLPIGLPPAAYDDGIAHVPIDQRDVPAGLMNFAQMRNRTLPVAAARFAQQVQDVLVAQFDADGVSPRRPASRNDR